MKGQLRRAIENKKKIEMIYLSAEGMVTQRSITIIQMNETHLIAYCHKRRQRRMFKIDHILSLEETA
ncbi:MULTISPECIES: WYL domain-containing protein [Alkalihalophilus]|jgi:predicted DNA-binding transcriptional regulator YafY|uniref:WYL domain-containing protein n=3 Tax=Alkalihalophilus TaxID=2893060 RepID=D3FXG1_ALKPO|nr:MULTISPECIES: WYL domain-containing protein [Alkalihalophilus]ADC50672.1 hypothetical protein BpOF4_13105 [Alkalihalophilus pseudofirmus OF4]ERN54654.1 hypothetical protein A33I_04725 [Alkalihalophilus marmarensis DSM 21297]MCM3488726.1 WYL domain-containing protein [Alkalihalophilus marmarensis]MDV2883877.1 WYL domain-containing protein [Alkalihalophilus pseudofirmus]MEC2070369.1 WYL domain-containing protein [Alkalihalophilus marmarensis]